MEEFTLLQTAFFDTEWPTHSTGTTTSSLTDEATQSLVDHRGHFMASSECVNGSTEPLPLFRAKPWDPEARSSVLKRKWSFKERDHGGYCMVVEA
ncbi:hypothetical protein KIN20_003999 [Parelaphostrongylus tenuis]|uniref:Uncharacterized protein n=1 Tax=Parelaphostrongylus tenuis TaxID=148309 RepID=A0AAD5MJ91_PARTN|nr:hypothetical protein KIN20_003999 [Parelaphostrongylus tenuis]